MKHLDFMTRRRKARHDDSVNYERVHDESEYLNTVKPYRQTKERLDGVKTVFMDESGDPGFTENTRSSIFSVAGVVTSDPKIINAVGDSYPDHILSRRFGLRDYKYTTLRESNYEELIQRMEQIADLPADMDIEVVRKKPFEVQSEQLEAYEVYRTLLHDLLADIIADHPGCTFDVQVDQNDFASKQEIEHECYQFPEVINVDYYRKTPFSPKKPGGCRVADLVASSANEYYDDSRHNRSMEPFSIIRRKVVNKNIAGEDPATAGTYNPATYEQYDSGLITFSLESNSPMALMARVSIPSQNVDYNVQIA